MSSSPLYKRLQQAKQPKQRSPLSKDRLSSKVRRTSPLEENKSTKQRRKRRWLQHGLIILLVIVMEATLLTWEFPSLQIVDEKKLRISALQKLSQTSPKYTSKCFAQSQKLYLDQIEARYAILRQPASTPNPRRYFFAVNLYNSFDVMPDLLSVILRLLPILGYDHVFLSVYENGSSDQTKTLLRAFDALASIAGLQFQVRTSSRKRGTFAHRIEYLAEVRNAAIAPLYRLRDDHDQHFDRIIFFNDVLPCLDDVLELLWQSWYQEAAITCGADYMHHKELHAPVFYDNWVSRDINGTALENAPFNKVFKDPESKERFQRHWPLQVQCCWNGIAILDTAPFYARTPVRFRMADLDAKECSASECSLICNDYWQAGYGRIVMVPRVKMAYSSDIWGTLHPSRLNLSSQRLYSHHNAPPADPMADPQDKRWYNPHDRPFHAEESARINFKPGPSHVWCSGWEGAGDLDGPDSQPVWEKMQQTVAYRQAADSRQRTV